jgi:enamine deaminase RidA (YjgF/YER057c/UK114 family)
LGSEDFDKMREVYRRQFTDGYPARMTATSAFIDPEILVMIEAVAYKPG